MRPLCHHMTCVSATAIHMLGRQVVLIVPPSCIAVTMSVPSEQWCIFPDIDDSQAPANRRLIHERWEEELAAVQRQPLNISVWTHLLAQMDIYYLFYPYLQSKLHFDAIMHFIEVKGIAMGLCR